MPFDQILPGPPAILPSQISDVIDQGAEAFGDRPAVLDGTGTWSFRDLAAAADAARDWLIGQDVRPGDRVMVVAENCRPSIALFFATAKTGAWPVMINPRLSAREIDAIREHCGARCILYPAPASALSRDHARRHQAVLHTVEGLGQVGASPIDRSVTPYTIEETGSDRIAALVYTSGSTGQPKGVMLTHGNFLFMAKAAVTIRSLTPEDRLYGVLPVSHIVGLSTVTLGTLLAGGSLFLVSRFNPADALRSLERDRITIMLGTPSMFAMMAEYADRKRIARVTAPSLRIISSSGAPLDPEIKETTERLFGLTLHNGYGITECSPTIAQTRPEQPRQDCSVGLPLPEVETELRVPPGMAGDGVGELWVRGPNVMKGYYADPEATAAVLSRDGWFNTQDLARFEDGNLFIVGRTRDLIIRFGFNVFPAEVEAVLNSHPAVRVSAVVGRPAPQGTEEVVAFVELKPDVEVTAEALRQYAAGRLTSYKQPSEVVILAALPTTAGGKILKRELSSAQPKISAAATER
jgi:acyl-CoA synthetase (AMP-forming)/AMP-acid ligase II